MTLALRLLFFAASLTAGIAWAGTLSVTSPNDGDFLGRNGSLSFTLRQSEVKARVTALVVKDDDPSVRFTFFNDFQPNVDGEVTGSLSLPFNTSTPAGNYTITVTVSEPGNEYNSVTRRVQIDTKNPEFVEVQPLQNAIVKGIVNIRVKLREPNIKEWRVKVNSQDIPNNSGTAEEFTVRWDASAIQFDGAQTITIDVSDEAGNSASKSISVTLDRVPPSISVLTPGSGAILRPRANVVVGIAIVDQASGAVDETGVDVRLETLDGVFIERVARRTAAASGNTLQWTGRIRWTSRLPSQFKMVVTAIDRAGNAAVRQEVIITVSSRGR